MTATSRVAEVRVPRQFAGIALALRLLKGATAGVPVAADATVGRKRLAVKGARGGDKTYVFSASMARYKRRLRGLAWLCTAQQNAPHELVFFGHKFEL